MLFLQKIAAPREVFYKANFQIHRRICLFGVNTWAKFVSPFDAKEVQVVADEIFRMDLGQEEFEDQYEVNLTTTKSPFRLLISTATNVPF